MDEPLLRLTNAGLYCSRGGFHVDPWTSVACAVVTHAHADHAVRGSRKYLTAESGRIVLQHRMGPNAQIQGLRYGEAVELNGVKVSLHPAGHILGSAQVRVEYCGEVWVVSGDYKVAPDVTCAAFEPVRCHTFITESTFAHPHFRWEPQAITFAQIHDWWRQNQAEGRASVLYGYVLGKSQRVLAGLDPNVGPIFVHQSIEEMNSLYRQSDVALPETRVFDASVVSNEWSRALLLLPPSARWDQAVPMPGPYATAFASGWMALPAGPVMRRVSTGFALSDHADYEETLSAIAATGAERVLVTHGYIDELVEILKSRGYDAVPHKTPRCNRPPRVTQRAKVSPLQKGLPFDDPV